MKYPLIRNKILRVYLYFWDFVYDVLEFCIQKKSFLDKIEKNEVHRILLRNPAAFGDVLYSLRIATALKSENPQVEIGMMAGSWTRGLLSACPAISHIHTENHWSVSQSGGSLPWRFLKWLKQWNLLRKEVQSIQYDLAVDLYYYFPSASFFFWAAHIPRRIGYDASGGSILFTESKHWLFEEKHNVEYQADLLRSIGYSLDTLSVNQDVFCFNTFDEVVLHKFSLQSKQYAVFHMGTSDPLREWTTERWLELAQFVEQEKLTICFTGKGKHEQELACQVIKNLGERNISLCDRLNLSELMQVIRNAVFFVGVESFAGHIAALYRIPQLSIMHGATNQTHWQPYGNPNGVVLRTEMSCSPCYFPKQCDKGNTCMDISVETAIMAVKYILNRA